MTITRESSLSCFVLVEGEMHGDGDGFQVMSSTIPMPHDGFDAEMNNNTMNYHEESDGQEYQDLEEDNDDHIYADTMSVNRPESKRPVSDLNPNKPSVTSTTPARTVFGAFNHWPNLFSKPTILVGQYSSDCLRLLSTRLLRSAGIVGGVVLGILSTVVLIMFIIYRMRKREEGSYVLDEGPRKSPSHAYTRVSSREFFA